MTLAYDGTAFAGWQVQPANTTIQGVLEAALKQVTGVQQRITASGRTDAGVHALGQVAAFECQTSLTPSDLCRALNANTPEAIVILELEEIQEGFHAIRDAVRKRYRYVLSDGPLMDIFSRTYCWHHWKRLDVEEMQRAAQLLLGTHDFVSFQAKGAERLTTVRTIFDIGFERRSYLQSGAGEGSKILFEVEADGFLYNMVRNIVGTLIEIGHGRKPIEWLTQVLSAKDRKAAGQTAPAYGLFLVKVDYS